MIFQGVGDGGGDGRELTLPKRAHAPRQPDAPDAGQRGRTQVVLLIKRRITERGRDVEQQF